MKTPERPGPAGDEGPKRGRLFDLSCRAKLRIRGADRLRFLNGQLTNDLRKATEETAIYACVLSAKGRINADVFISAQADSYLLDAAPELREELPARLDRYLIADDVQMDDVSDEFALFHVTGESAAGLPNESRMISAERFGCPGWDVWCGAGAHERTLRELSLSVPGCDEQSAEILRIERGIPRWGLELTPEIIPTEANLEARAIDYAKGCYIGQEVISRIKMSGQTNKRLCGLLSKSGAPLRSGMRLIAGSDENKEVGWVTSGTRSERREIALGYLKRGFNSIGAEALAISPDDGDGVTPVPVAIVSLPFV